jgi:AcrR family transcriptional regulator
MATRQDPGTRDRLLDAGEAVLLERGAAALTLEAVAARAGVSKGGLLYHFRSKETLVAGMIERIVAGVEAALAPAAADSTPGTFTRAYIDTVVADRPEPPGTSRAGRLTAALAAAAALDPALLAPLREAYGRWQRRLVRDGLDPATATLARLATDGWWLSALLGLPPFDDDLHGAVRAALHGLTRPDPVVG